MFSSNSDQRAYVVPAGTVNSCILKPWFPSGLVVSKLFVGSSGTVSALVSAGMRPRSESVSAPLQPVLTLHEVDPLGPVPVTCAGAATAAAATMIGLRTLCVPSDQVNAPRGDCRTQHRSE